MTPKEEILDLLKKLPDDASFDFIAECVESFAESARIQAEETPEERAEILAAIARGLEDHDAGRIKTHEEVRGMLERWSKDGSFSVSPHR